jgi:hypothetical protein
MSELQMWRKYMMGDVEHEDDKIEGTGVSTVAK